MGDMQAAFQQERDRVLQLMKLQVPRVGEAMTVERDWGNREVGARLVPIGREQLTVGVRQTREIDGRLYGQRCQQLFGCLAVAKRQDTRAVEGEHSGLGLELFDFRLTNELDVVDDNGHANQQHEE